jgi:hypothetical protein
LPRWPEKPSELLMDYARVLTINGYTDKSFIFLPRGRLFFLHPTWQSPFTIPNLHSFITVVALRICSSRKNRRHRRRRRGRRRRRRRPRGRFVELVGLRGEPVRQRAEGTRGVTALDRQEHGSKAERRILRRAKSFTI